MLRKLQPFVLLAFLTFSQPVGAADLLVDGVPLPSDATVAATTPGSAFQQWSGVWVGVWGDSPKHILLVESVSEDGAAHVVYAIGENPYAGIQPRWLRLEGIASGRTLKVTGKGFTATYEMAEDGSLKARFERGDIASSTTMAKTDFASLTRPDAVVAWTRGKSEFLQTDLIEDGKPVRLEVVIFRPAGQHDRFYSIAHSRDNFAAFEKAGGQGKFFEFDMPVGQGHSLIGRPNLWSGPLGSYLSSLAAAENH